MDKGAARSRKQAQRIQHQPEPSSRSHDADTSTTRDRPIRTSEPGPSRFRPKIIDNTDPSRFRPKAIRESAALVWAQQQFAIPPSPEALSKVTRVDLTGSDCTDISWLEGTKVTWLSLKGCKVQNGWDAVASLQELSVLNISDTGLQQLPSSWSSLRSLKALVAMNLSWSMIDDSVIEHWAELNSLIVSHSPNLSALPKSLQSLSQLSKITFSHCPRITARGLPDLSSLPLLRDVKMNNLALLDALPPHLSKWGTGVLPTIDRISTVRHGDGLQVLDLGNCSLPFAAIQATFLSQKWSHLRSLTLHSNPLVLTHPDFATQLQESDTLPNLQIIDSKRIVQRKRQGEIQESKIERRRREKKEKRRMTGANAKESSGSMRVWGGAKEEGEAVQTISKQPGSTPSAAASPSDVASGPVKSGKRKRPSKSTADPNPSDERVKAPVLEMTNEVARETPKRVKRSKDSLPDKQEQIAKPAVATTPSQSTAIMAPSKAKRSERSQADHDKKPVQTDSSDHKVPDDPKGKSRKGQGGKVETVAQSAGGVDLKNVFAKPSLDVGGW